jgi:hypothetical protein
MPNNPNTEENLKPVAPRLPTWFLGALLAVAVVGWWGIRRPPGPIDVSGTVASAEHKLGINNSNSAEQTAPAPAR